MNVFILKGKWLIFALVILSITAGVLGMSTAINVFRIGNRDIPIYSVERNDDKIAITFDCAWNDDDIDEILNVLDKYNAKATFFVVGDWAKKYPQSLKKIYEHGHEIGNHSFDHKDYTKLSKQEMLYDMEQCDNEIKSIIGTVPTLFRAPSGAYNNTVVKTAEDSKRKYIQWSVDGLDYKNDATPETIYNKCTQNIKNGDIILLHNGTKYTKTALVRILDNLTKRFSPVIVSDMLYDEYTLDHSGRMFEKNTAQ